MLPDYPEQKSYFDAFLIRVLRDRVRHYTRPFSKGRVTEIFEGDATSITREEGGQETNKLASASGELRIKHEELSELTLAAFIERLDAMAMQMAEQQLGYFTKTLDHAVTKVGNVVKNRGDIVETIFEMFETIHLNFKKDGSLPELDFFGGSVARENYEKAMQEIHSTPALKQRYNQILARKWGEWRDREASRRLVG